MEIIKAQQEVDLWIKEKGVRYFNELTNMVLLVEEVGEMARIIARKYGEQSVKPGEENLNLEEEIGDVFFVLICLANQTGIDLNSALIASFKKKNLRDQNRHINNPKLK
jgi:NTP pyrophosphatase (non-canonical NTP hydrolase)